MAHLITRRTALALGGSALVAGTAGAQIQTRPATPPNLPIERGASLRMLRPVRFVQPDEEVWRANCARFAQQNGIEVRVDFVGWEDINQQTAVTANTGAGPDVIVGFDAAPHIYADKIHDMTDVATYLGEKYGGWRPLARAYGTRQNRWLSIPMCATGAPKNWRTSACGVSRVRQRPPDTCRASCGSARRFAHQQALGLRAGQRGRRRQRLRELDALVARRLHRGREWPRRHQPPRDDRGDCATCANCTRPSCPARSPGSTRPTTAPTSARRCG
jgi:hypothetical protein